MRCAEPVQSVTVSPIGDFVYIGGNFTFIDDTPVATTPLGTNASWLSLNVVESSIRPEHFFPDVGANTKVPRVHDIAVPEGRDRGLCHRRLGGSQFLDR